MKIIKLFQGSDEWKQWRKSRITATSAGGLMMHNFWKTPLDLYKEMLEMVPPQETNAAMQRGSDMEPIARSLFIEMTGLEMEPIVCESDEHFWMAASLDGWNEENKAILEIKCPNEKTHLLALSGDMPDYYRDQIMHQLAVTGGAICYYMSYRPEHEQKVAIVQVKPNPEYMAELIEVEKKFYYENICEMVEPDSAWTLKTTIKAPPAQ